MTKRYTWLSIGVIIAATCAAMGPVAFNGFSGWDDPHTLLENPSLDPPTFGAVARYWRTAEGGLYVPLTYTAWAMLAAVARSADGTLVAWPFHVASLLAHALANVVVFLILRRAVARDWPACAGAVLFAVHPIQVETVAWASGLKDVLAGLFAFAAVHQYLLHADGRVRWPHYLLGSAALVLGMLSKPSAACAIPIAAVLDVLVLRRPFRRVAASLAPWVLLAVPLLLVARVAQETQGVPDVALWRRGLVAADALAFYLFKLVAPVNLAIDYGRTPAVAIDSRAAFVTWTIPAAVALAIAATRSRVLAAAGLMFVSGMLMNLGLAPFQFQYYSTVADHYVYVSMSGPALAVGWAVSRRPRLLTAVLCAVVALALVVLAHRQARRWSDAITLLQHSVEVNPDAPGLRNNLGRALGEAGRLDEAAQQFEAVLRLVPYDPMAHRNLALVAVRRGDLDAAVRHLAESIRLNERAGADTRGDRSELQRLMTETSRARPVPRPTSEPATSTPAPRDD